MSDLSHYLEQHVEILSIPDHARDWVARDAEGQLRPIYTYDLTGRLIHTRAPAPGLNPFNETSTGVAFQEDVGIRQPWHYARSRFEREFAEWFADAEELMVPSVEAIYPNGEIPTVDAIWAPVPRSSGPVKTQWLENVIAAVEKNRRAEHSRSLEAALERLAEKGAFLMPRIEGFHPRYHTTEEGSIEPGTPIVTRRDGWMLRGAVFQRAVVTATISE